MGKHKHEYSYEEKVAFLDLYHKNDENMMKSCNEFGISRTTGYIFVNDEDHIRERFEQQQGAELAKRDFSAEVNPVLNKTLDAYITQMEAEFDERWKDLSLTARKKVRAKFLEELFWKHAQYLVDEIEQLSAKDRYTAMGIIEDKLRMLHDEPTIIVQYRNAYQEMLMAILIEKVGKEKTLEIATALEEVDDAEIIQEMG